jgi:hypothetical protein
MNEALVMEEHPQSRWAMSAWMTAEPVTSCSVNDGQCFVPALCDSLLSTLPTHDTKVILLKDTARAA